MAYEMQQQAARAAYSGGQRTAEVEDRTFAEQQRQFNATQKDNKQKVEQAQKDQLLRTQQAQSQLDMAKEQLKLAQDKFKQSSDTELQLILSGKARAVGEGENPEFNYNGKGYTTAEKAPQMLQPEPAQQTTITTQPDIQPESTSTTPTIKTPAILKDKPLLVREYELSTKNIEQLSKSTPKPSTKRYTAKQAGQYRTAVSKWESQERTRKKELLTARKSRINVLKEAVKAGKARDKELNPEQLKLSQKVTLAKTILSGSNSTGDKVLDARLKSAGLLTGDMEWTEQQQIWAKDILSSVTETNKDKYNKLRASGLSKEKARRRLGL